MLLATILEFTLPLYDRCSHSLFLFITQTHNNTESASDVKSQAESFGF